MADEFSEDEIRQELYNLGYRDIPVDRLARLKRDLDMFVAIERSKNSSDSVTVDESSLLSSQYATEETGTDVNSSSGGIQRRSDYQFTKTHAHLLHSKHADSSGPELHVNINDSEDNYSNTRNSSLGYEQVNEVNKSTQAYTDVDHADNLIPEQITVSRFTDETHQNKDYRDGGPNPLRTYYVSVPERDLLTGYTSHDLDTSATSTSTTNDRKKQMKRKVLRKVDGEKHIDESITESETDDDVYGLMHRLTRLPLNERTNHQEKYVLPRRPCSATEPTYRLPDNYDGPKSLIRPATAHPHTKNIKKNDPVNRHLMYQQSWSKHRLPEEKNHKSLRWSVREQMLHHDEVVKKTQRSYVPNSYVVPSDKKRKALRWQVRQDMAEGVVPSSQWY